MIWATMVLRDHLGRFILVKNPRGREPEDRLNFPATLITHLRGSDVEERNRILSTELRNLLGIVVPQEDWVYLGSIIYCETNNEQKLFKINSLLPIGSIQNSNPRFGDISCLSIPELYSLEANSAVDPNAFWIAATSTCRKIGNQKAQFSCYYDEYD